jgi:hypothetical protein
MEDPGALVLLDKAWADVPGARFVMAAVKPNEEARPDNSGTATTLVKQNNRIKPNTRTLCFALC